MISSFSPLSSSLHYKTVSSVAQWTNEYRERERKNISVDSFYHSAIIIPAPSFVLTAFFDQFFSFASWSMLDQRLFSPSIEYNLI